MADLRFRMERQLSVSSPHSILARLYERREQANPLMNRLQIPRRKVRIPSGHLQRAMPQHLLQMEDRAAAPDVVHGERMPESVQRASWRLEAEAATQGLYRIEGRHTTERFGSTHLLREQQRLRHEAEVRHIPMHGFPQRKRERDDPLLPSLPVERNEQVVQVCV